MQKEAAISGSNLGHIARGPLCNESLKEEDYMPTGITRLRTFSLDKFRQRLYPWGMVGQFGRKKGGRYWMEQIKIVRGKGKGC